jgi:uncharacterized protein YcbX
MIHTARVTGLFHYPVKSARGVSLRAAKLCATGIEHDREWLVVDARDCFVTQREQPQLATLQVAVAPDYLLLETPGQPALQIALNGDAPPSQRRVQIWRDNVDAIDMGESVARWLSLWLGGEYRLVRFDARTRRLSDRAYSGEVGAANLFSDGYPLLVLSQASLDDLSRRVGRELPVERFRPNILIDGIEPYEEDRINELQIGAARLRLVKACTRCVITTTDQQSGLRDGDEPLRTLKSFRFDTALGGVVFAQNAIIVGGVDTMLRVGDQAFLRGK